MNTIIDMTNRLNLDGRNRRVRVRSATKACCDIHNWSGTLQEYQAYRGCPICRFGYDPMYEHRRVMMLTENMVALTIQD
jgi:hypothetical protein